MKKTTAFIREIKREDFWIVPFTAMTLILGAYAATTQKPVLWLSAGLLIVGMLIFTAILIAYKYSRKRSVIHVALAGILLIIATRFGFALM